MELQHRVRARIRLVGLALVALGCTDQAGQLPTAIEPLAQVTAGSAAPHFLQQARTAPRLSTYQTSFWAKRGTQTTVSVRYRLAPGQKYADEFLRFRIPINGLVAGANGVPLDRGDSVQITLTIDPVLLKVVFQPSGVVFSKSSPAQLAIWYQNADPDLNGDGVVDAVDQALEEQLAIWSQSGHEAWRQLSTKKTTTQQYVAAEVQHFSQFGVSW